MKNLKPDRLFFVSEVKRIITEHGAEQTGSYRYEPNKPDYMDSDSYLIKTVNNKLKLTVHSELDHCLIYSVFGMLELPNSRIGNPWNGKVNFHARGEVKGVVSDFEDWLANVLKVLANDPNNTTPDPE